MSVFVDTSALYALLDTGDRNHASAERGLLAVLDAPGRLLTHSYVVAESCALVQRRLGPERAIHLLDELLPLCRIVWVNAELHETAVAEFRASASRSVSLVDRVSFALMRREAVGTAFAFDRDFEEQGFALLAAAGSAGPTSSDGPRSDAASRHSRR